MICDILYDTKYKIQFLENPKRTFYGNLQNSMAISYLSKSMQLPLFSLTSTNFQCFLAFQLKLYRMVVTNITLANFYLHSQNIVIETSFVIKPYGIWWLEREKERQKKWEKKAAAIAVRTQYIEIACHKVYIPWIACRETFQIAFVCIVLWVTIQFCSCRCCCCCWL